MDPSPRWGRSSRASTATRWPRTSTAAGAGRAVVVDGREHDLYKEDKGFFLAPSLIDDVTPEMDAYKDEIFGPVLSVTRLETYDQAVDLVNRSPYGNGVALFTRDGGAARQFVFEVEAGMVGINVPIPVPVAYYSFGGWEALPVRRRAHVRPRGLPLLHARKVVTQRWPTRHLEGRPGLPQHSLGPAGERRLGARRAGGAGVLEVHRAVVRAHSRNATTSPSRNSGSGTSSPHRSSPSLMFPRPSGVPRGSASAARHTTTRDRLAVDEALGRHVVTGVEAGERHAVAVVDVTTSASRTPNSLARKSPGSHAIVTPSGPRCRRGRSANASTSSGPPRRRRQDAEPPPAFHLGDRMARVHERPVISAARSAATSRPGRPSVQEPSPTWKWTVSSCEVVLGRDRQRVVELLVQDAELRRPSPPRRGSRPAGRPRHDAPARGFTRTPTVDPGARRPNRSSCESRSRFTCTPLGDGVQVASDRFVPVNEISRRPSVRPARGRPPPGEQTSTPTDPSARTNARTSGVPLRLQREPEPERRAGPLERAHERPRLLLDPDEVIGEDRAFRARAPRPRRPGRRRPGARRARRVPASSTTGSPCRTPMLASGTMPKRCQWAPLDQPSTSRTTTRRGVPGPRRRPAVRDARRSRAPRPDCPGPRS